MGHWLNYRRPSYVTSSRASTHSDSKSGSSNESIESGKACMLNGIPPALSFDRIISSGTCPPVTTRDMMNYLKYIEHSAENLQFFLWHRDYTARWQKLADSDKALSPEWERSKLDAELFEIPTGRGVSRLAPPVAALAKDEIWGKSLPTVAISKIDPFNRSPKLESFDEKQDGHSDFGTSASFSSDEKISSTMSAPKLNGDQAFDDAGMHWKPFTSQPFRDEIIRIIGTYIAEGSPRELNLSARERKAALHALQHTTHPSAFHHIADTVEWSLRRQAHPNFIRWTICNGNRPRVIFARGLGLSCILLALLADLLLTLSHASRPWRVLPFPIWFLGIATLIAAVKGMCVVLHGLHHRHLRPWELFSDNESHATDEAFLSSETLSNSINSFETEPWVPKYEKRNIIRKVFDREIWIQEPALRQIQDAIFFQSILGGAVIGGVMVGIFCACPRGNFF